MLTSSCKAKGRKLQQLVRDSLLVEGHKFGLVAGDITSTSMGASGVDVVLSPAAKKVYGDLAVECKAVEALNVPGTYFEHAAKYSHTRLRLLVHKRNAKLPLVTLAWSDFLDLLVSSASHA